jgi:RES domain-containing protein
MADMNIVCANCFDDDDLQKWICEQNGPFGCDACGQSDSPTVELADLCGYLRQCLSNFYSSAIEELPLEMLKEGTGTWSTVDLIFDTEMLDLPRDMDGHLYDAIMAITCDDDEWCEYDWLSLDADELLRINWESFCQTIKHERRFFFLRKGHADDDRESLSSAELLEWIVKHVQKFGLIRRLSSGTTLWRARSNINPQDPHDATTFGPPPPKLATQSNRMNPPGIPMFYVSESAASAVREIRATSAKVGHFMLTRDITILDLNVLPKVPGIFSNPSREETLALKFLHHFRKAIMEPVARDDRAHIEYIPSQVVTEYFREYRFPDGYIDGIRYPSTVHPGGSNVVIFISGNDSAPEGSITKSNLAQAVNFLGWKIESV